MSKELSDIYFFEDLSKKKLDQLSKTYEELSKLYTDMPTHNGEICGCERKDYLYTKRIMESELVLSKQLKDVSDAVGEVADTIIHVNYLTENRKKSLAQYLKKSGILLKDVMYLEIPDESPKLRIVARIGRGQTIPVDEMAGILSVYFDKRIVASVDSEREVKKNFQTFLFEEEPKYSVISATSRAIKEKENVSGDSFGIDELSNGKVAIMIADGMGSGELACKDSQSVVEFMEKFLDAGFQSRKAVSMINAAILATGQGENLTTLDYCDINLRTGETEFLKAGATISFIKSGSKVIKISSDTLPLGSFLEISILTQTVFISHGDMIILLSDGITDSFDEDALGDIIARYDTHNPKDMSDYLLTYAINCNKGRILDDMTVLVAGVWQNY